MNQVLDKDSATKAKSKLVHVGIAPIVSGLKQYRERGRPPLTHPEGAHTMSWFSEYVGDPLKALLAKVEATGEADLKALAGQVAAQLPAAPISAAAETAFETALTAAADGLIKTVVGEVPVAGAALAPAAVTAGNAAIDYMVQKGAASLNTLAAAAKARLSAVAAPAAATGVAPGAVG